MLNRHDLLFLNKIGKAEAIKNCSVVGCSVENKVSLVKTLNEDVPVIVARQENFEDGYINVGISTNLKVENVRVKGQAKVSINNIKKVVTPFNICENYDFGKYKKIVGELINLGKENGLSLGLYGSIALEIVTSMPYTDYKSDIDILIKKENVNSNLNHFYESLLQIGAYNKIKVDGEVLFDGFGIKIKELMSNQKTVLGKSIDTVEIFNKNDILSRW